MILNCSTTATSRTDFEPAAPRLLPVREGCCRRALLAAARSDSSHGFICRCRLRSHNPRSSTTAASRLDVELAEATSSSADCRRGRAVVAAVAEPATAAAAAATSSATSTSRWWR